MWERVVVDPTCRTRWQRFAASDDERLAAVCAWRAIRSVDLAIALRGGYGWTRLLPRLDFAAIAAARKQWLGYSDFTAFQLAALAHAGMVTFAGPIGRAISAPRSLPRSRSIIASACSTSRATR